MKSTDMRYYYLKTLLTFEQSYRRRLLPTGFRLVHRNQWNIFLDSGYQPTTVLNEDEMFLLFTKVQRYLSRVYLLHSVG